VSLIDTVLQVSGCPTLSLVSAGQTLFIYKLRCFILDESCAGLKACEICRTSAGSTCGWCGTKNRCKSENECSAGTCPSEWYPSFGQNIDKECPRDLNPEEKEEEEEEEKESYLMFALLATAGVVLTLALVLWGYRHQQTRGIVAMYESLGQRPDGPTELGFEESIDVLHSHVEEPMAAVMDRDAVTKELRRHGHFEVIWTGQPRLWPAVRYTVAIWLLTLSLLLVLAIKSDLSDDLEILRVVAWVTAFFWTVILIWFVGYRAGTCYVLTENCAIAYHSFGSCCTWLDEYPIEKMDALDASMDEHGYGSLRFSSSVPAWEFNAFLFVQGIPKVHSFLASKGIGASSSPAARSIASFRVDVAI